MKLHLLAGMPGSGKSTTALRIKANNHDSFIISTDQLRLEANSGKYPKGISYDILEPIIEKLAYIEVKQLLSAKCEVVIDTTNLNKKKRKKWIDLAHSVNNNIEIILYWHVAHFDSPERWLTERNIDKEEYQNIREKLSKTIESPDVSEGFSLKIVSYS